MLVVQLTVDQLSSLIESVVAKTLREQLPSPPDNYITAKEAAKRLGISRQTLHRRAKEGLIETHLIGKTKRFKESEIEAVCIAFQPVKRPKIAA